VDEKRKLALMLAGVEPEEPNLVGLSRYGLGYQPDLGTDSEGDVTTGDMLAKMGRMQSGPGGLIPAQKMKASFPTGSAQPIPCLFMTWPKAASTPWPTGYRARQK
jgi:hypothetical protein